VNLFIQAVAHTAALFAKQREYEAWGWEIHHSAKKMRHPERCVNWRKKCAPAVTNVS
jgi:hypothetical protein